MQIADMGSENTSELSNSSSLQHKWYDMQTYYDTRTMLFSSTANLLMCVVGTPGNVLVMTVYVQKMTSSVRAYMFALAVADLTTCVGGIVLSVAPVDHTAMVLVFFTGDISISFSTFLLAFIAIERLLAVRRPFAFKFNAGRAKKTLVVFASVSVVGSAILEFARLLRYDWFILFSPMMAAVPAVSVMIVCYVLMGVTMFQKKRASQTKVRDEADLQNQGPSTSSNGGNTIATCSLHLRRAEHKPTAMATQINVHRSVWLLFTITAVYIVCWMPLWLHYAGLSVPVEIRGVFLINSVANPFIYSVVSAMFRSDVKIVCRQICARSIAP